MVIRPTLNGRRRSLLVVAFGRFSAYLVVLGRTNVGRIMVETGDTSRPYHDHKGRQRVVLPTIFRRQNDLNRRSADHNFPTGELSGLKHILLAPSKIHVQASFKFSFITIFELIMFCSNNKKITR